MALVLGFASVYSARAYNDYQTPACAWPYLGGNTMLTVYYRNGSQPSAYATPFAAARTSWFNTDTPAAFSYSSGASSTHLVAALGGSDLGITYVACSGSTATSATVYLNSSKLGTGAYATASWRQYTAAHELGHNLALGHSYYLPAVLFGSAPTPGFPNTPYPAGGYNGPVPDDECAVNSKYPSTAWPLDCGY